MVAGAGARGKSELHRAGCPVKAGEAGCRPVDSPDWRIGAAGARATETMPDACERGGVKRAILPAAISDPAVIRLLAEAESREQPRPRRRGRSGRETERDDHQQTELGLLSPLACLNTMVPLAQSAERLSVEQEVTGSSPVRHPTENPRKCAGFRHSVPDLDFNRLNADCCPGSTHDSGLRPRVRSEPGRASHSRVVAGGPSPIRELAENVTVTDRLALLRTPAASGPKCGEIAMRNFILDLPSR